MFNCFKERKNASAFLFVFLLFMTFSTQASAQFWFGGGLVYGEGIERLGVQANANLVVNEDQKIRIAGDLTYFLVDKSSALDVEFKTRVFTINANGHYMLVSSDQIVVYGIGGLNFAIVSVSASGAGSQFIDLLDTNSTEVGLNIGGGLEYELDFGRVYGELKYVLGGFDQVVIGAGVRIPIIRG